MSTGSVWGAQIWVEPDAQLGIRVPKAGGRCLAAEGLVVIIRYYVAIRFSWPCFSVLSSCFGLQSNATHAVHIVRWKIKYSEVIILVI